MALVKAIHFGLAFSIFFNFVIIIFNLNLSKPSLIKAKATEYDASQPIVQVAMLIQATGNYASWTVKMIDSARRFFLNQPGFNVSFLIFSDHLNQIATGDDVVGTEQKRMGWPSDSMYRHEIYLNNSHLFKDKDFIFCADADLRFVGDVGFEILGDLVGTQHPGYWRSPPSSFPYDRNPNCCAFVNQTTGDGWQYFYGAFYGGRTKNVVSLFENIKKCASQDKKNKIIPLWHDESYLNHFFIKSPPSIILSPSYSTIEGQGKKKKLGFLMKLIIIFNIQQICL